MTSFFLMSILAYSSCESVGSLLGNHDMEKTLAPLLEASRKEAGLCFGDKTAFARIGDLCAQDFDLTQDEVTALEHYVRGRLNDRARAQLRGRVAPSASTTQDIQLLRSALQKFPPIPKGTVLLRGERNLPIQTPGALFARPSFLSTTLSRKVALRFSNDRGLVEITLAQPVRAAQVQALELIAPDSQFALHEQEIILPPGGCFEVVKDRRRTRGGTLRVHLHYGEKCEEADPAPF